MMIFDFLRKKQKKLSYDRENLKPVIRASICTGEQVAGFRDIRTGKLTEVMLIRTDGDLEEFMSLYDLSPEEIITTY